MLGTLYRRKGSKPSPRKKNVKKQKMAVSGGLTNSCEKKRGKKQRRKGKINPFEWSSKNSKERYESLPYNQCREIEENNRTGMTRDLFKKMRDTKGTFHAKMGTIKDRNCLNLTDADEIKKRWKELYRKIFMTQIITMV